MGEAKRRKKALGPDYGKRSRIEEYMGVTRGQKCPFGPFGEGAAVAFGDGKAPQFFVTLDGMTRNEEMGGRQDTLKIGLVPYGDHTAFFMLSAERLSKGWLDTPFSLGAVPEDKRIFPEVTSDQGFLSTLWLVEKRDNTVRGIRGFTMSPAFSSEVLKEVERQRANLVLFSPAAHQAEVEKAYRECPSPTDLMTKATTLETAGSEAAFRAARNDPSAIPTV